MGTEKRGDGTVGKALDVLNEVAEIGSPVRFSSLLKTSKYPKATLYRLLQTLLNQDMLSYNDEEQTYKLGLKLVRMAHAAWLQSSLAPIALPFIDELSDKVSETVHLAQLDNGQVLYVDKRNPSSPIEMYSQAGKVGPAYCTGVGKAMMAFLDEDELSRVISKQAFFNVFFRNLNFFIIFFTFGVIAPGHTFSDNFFCKITFNISKSIFSKI